jgi:signal peptidase I
MAPTLKQGQHVLLNTADQHAQDNRIRRGDIVAFRNAMLPGKLLIKRIIGLPGEKIKLEGNTIFINGEILTEHHVSRDMIKKLPMNWSTGRDEYVVLGDNRMDSLDSRRLGVIPSSNVEGKVWFRLWPLQYFSKN